MVSNKWCQSFGTGWLPQRYLLTFMCFLGVVISYVHRSYLSIAITRMVKSDNTHSTCNNETDNRVEESNQCGDHQFSWDESMQGYVLSSFYLGYLISHIPGAYLSRKLGGKYTMGVSVLVSSLFSVLSPLAACHSSGALIATRFSIGLAEGTTFPAISELLSQWAPPSERTMLASTVFAAVQVGTVVSTSLAGYMLEVMSWGQIFYILGSVGGAWFILWVFLCYNTPSTHPFISSSELEYLQNNIPNIDKTMPTPWKEILHSKPVWALIIAQMGHGYGLFTMLSDLPKYYCSIANLSISRIGVLSGLPYLIIWLISVLLGYFTDKIILMKLVSRTRLRTILAAIGTVVPGIGMVWASYISNRSYLFVLVTISMAFMACCYASIRVNPLDLSPNHAATIMALANGGGSFSGLIAPSAVGAIIKENSKEEWQLVFWIVLVVLIISNFPFIIYGSGDIQHWDKPIEEPNVSDLRRRSTISGGEPIREKYKNYYPEQSVIKE